MELPRGAPIVIRPGGVGEVLDAGIRLARRNYWSLVLLGAWGLIPWYVVEAIFSTIGGIGQQQIAANILQHPVLLLFYVLFGVASVIVVGLSFLAVLLACGRLITGEDTPGELPVANLYRQALGRLGAYVLLLIIGVVLAIPLTILFPLGMYLSVRWAPVLAALVIEGKGPIAALGRGWQLTRGAWWHTLGTLLVWTILAIILEILLGGILGAVGTVLTLSGSPVVGVSSRRSPVSFSPCWQGEREGGRLACGRPCVTSLLRPSASSSSWW